MKRFIPVILSSLLLMGIGDICKAQRAVILFDEAKKITGSLGGVINKIAHVNDKRLYPGDTVEISSESIEFKVRVNYLEQENREDNLDVNDDMPSIRKVSLRNIQQDKKLIKVKHYARPIRHVALPQSQRMGKMVDYWTFIFPVQKSTAGSQF